MQMTLLEIDQRSASLRRRLAQVPAEARRRLEDRLRLSWIYHDHAIEGEVLTESELERGVGDEPGKDTCEQKLLTGIHRLNEAIVWLQRTGDERPTIDLDYLKRLHVLCAAADDPAAGRYRKSDQPGGVYNHSCPPARSISYRMRKLLSFIEEEAPTLHPIRGAARVHHGFMGVFPFEERSGAAGRLLLSDWLMRHHYPPVILSTSVRAEYFDALRDGPEALVEVVATALSTTIDQSLTLLERLQTHSSAA